MAYLSNGLPFQLLTKNYIRYQLDKFLLVLTKYNEIASKIALKKLILSVISEKSEIKINEVKPF
jgi:hypothetical protein